MADQIEVTKLMGAVVLDEAEEAIDVTKLVGASVMNAPRLTVTKLMGAAILSHPIPMITTGCPLPDAVIGVPYSLILVATGCLTLTWTVIAGSLPPGFTLNAATGE